VTRITALCKKKEDFKMLKLVGRVDRRRGAHLPSAMFAVVLLFGSTGASLAQGGIGDARTVINSVLGNLASGSSGPVAQGDSVYRDESVLTRADSKAALVLEDQTNVTVGPSSTIKLDRFVYAGAAKPGTIALNLAKGTLRLATGDAAKRSYTIYTPTAVIGTRD
jgi:hypothetical protein